MADQITSTQGQAAEQQGPAEKIPMVLTTVLLAARDTNLYTFRRADGAKLPGARPGAHIVLHLPNGVERQYSLINTDNELEEYIVGVKLDPNSRGGSLYMHNQLRLGLEILVESPRNNFPLVEDTEHVVLFAGGIGITPIYCMVKRLVKLGRSWELHYSSRSRADTAFREELEQHSQAHFHFDDEEGGVLPIGSIVSKLSKTAHLYCCGPTPMLSAFENAAADWPPEQLHVEYFTPKFTAAEEGGYIVELSRSKKELTIPPGKSILQVAREHGINVPYSCEEGICGACETRVVSGEPDHRDSVLSESERKQNATMMICCSGSKSPRLVLDL